jgi:hypothetical protein
MSAGCQRSGVSLARVDEHRREVVDADARDLEPER